MSSAIAYQANAEKLDSVLIPVSHVTQSHDWDCGIACLKMTISEGLRQRFTNNFMSIWDEVKCGKRVWTIDLAYVLRRLNVPHLYCTITIGVDPRYDEKSYYNHDKFMSEVRRVNEQFALAGERNIRIEKRSVELSEICDHLASLNTAIVLVDNAILKCNHWRHSLNTLSRMLSSEECYSGHYIVLCGFNKQKRSIFFRNPGYRDGVCKTSFENFDAARKRHGTDEDILFVYKDEI